MNTAQVIFAVEVLSFASEHGLSLKEASHDLGAEPRHYVRLRKISGSLRLHILNWYRLRKIQTLRRVLDQQPTVTNYHPVVLELESLFAELEFGVPPRSPEERYYLRTKVLRQDLQSGDLNAAHRSIAVKKTAKTITYREFHSRHLRLFSWARDLSLATVLALYFWIFDSAIVDGCVTCYQLGAAFLAHYVAAASVIAWWLVWDSTKASTILKSLGFIPSRQEDA